MLHQGLSLQFVVLTTALQSAPMSRSKQEYVDVELGGQTSKIGYDTQFGIVTTPGNTEYDRPQYVTTERQKTSGAWESCSGDRRSCENCWQGTGGSMLCAATRKSFGYQALAAEVVTKCRNNGKIQVIAQNVPHRNAGRVKIYFNGVLQTDSLQAGLRNKLVIQSTSATDSQVLRMELVASSDAHVYAKVQIRVANEVAGFDECMSMKQNHASCTEMLGGTMDRDAIVLRSDHSRQLECLQSTSPKGACKKWHICLDPETKKLLEDLLATAVDSNGELVQAVTSWNARTSLSFVTVSPTAGTGPTHNLITVSNAASDCSNEAPCQRTNGILLSDPSVTTSVLTASTIDHDQRWCGGISEQSLCKQLFTFLQCEKTASTHTIYYPCKWNPQGLTTKAGKTKYCTAGEAFTAPDGVSLADGSRHGETCDTAGDRLHMNGDGAGEHCLEGETMDAATLRCKLTSTGSSTDSGSGTSTSSGSSTSGTGTDSGSSTSGTSTSSEAHDCEAENDHATCIDPRHNMDLEAWNCKCHDTWARECTGQSGTVRQACLKRMACRVPKICCSWKKANNCPALLLETRTKPQAGRESEINTEESSLDSAVAGKCSNR